MTLIHRSPAPTLAGRGAGAPTTSGIGSGVGDGSGVGLGVIVGARVGVGCPVGVHVGSGAAPGATSFVGKTGAAVGERTFTASAVGDGGATASVGSALVMAVGATTKPPDCAATPSATLPSSARPSGWMKRAVATVITIRATTATALHSRRLPRPGDMAAGRGRAGGGAAAGVTSSRRAWAR